MMTREELLSLALDYFKRRKDVGLDDVCQRAENTAIEAIEVVNDYKVFIEWVMDEIFDPYWEYNQDAFAEVACRKLEKLGMVKAVETDSGIEWVRVDDR